MEAAGGSARAGIYQLQDPPQPASHSGTRIMEIGCSIASITFIYRSHLVQPSRSFSYLHFFFHIIMEKNLWIQQEVWGHHGHGVEGSAVAAVPDR